MCNVTNQKVTITDSALTSAQQSILVYICLLFLFMAHQPWFHPGN